jgi:hypothetical protein
LFENSSENPLTIVPVDNPNNDIIFYFNCLGSTPTNATICLNDDQDLPRDTQNSLVASCSNQRKCEYICDPGFSIFKNTCIPTPINQLPTPTSVTLISPGGNVQGGQDSIPTLRVSGLGGEIETSVRLYSDSQCTQSLSLWSAYGVVRSKDITTQALTNSVNYKIYARLKDQKNMMSACSTNYQNYREVKFINLFLFCSI